MIDHVRNRQNESRINITGAFFTLFFLSILLFSPNPAFATSLDEYDEILMLLYKKYILYGDFALTYESIDTEVDSNGFVSEGDVDRFTQDFVIHLRSYVYHPKLLTYDVGFGWRNSSGSSADTDLRRYSLDLDFLRTRPFHAKFSAEYIDADTYDAVDLGMSIAYFRSKQGITFRNMREASLYRRTMARQRILNNSKNNNLNANQNNNNSDGNNNYNNYNSYNQYNNYNNYDNYRNTNNNNYNVRLIDRDRRRLLKPKGKFFDRILPTGYFFDFFWSTYDSSVDRSKNDHFFSSLRFQGDYETLRTTTSYTGSLGYRYSENERVSGTDDETDYYGEFTTTTRFRNRSRLHVKVRYDIEEERTEDYNYFYLDAMYSGSFIYKKTWGYYLSATYDDRSNSRDTSTLRLQGAVSSSSRVGRINMNYSLGARYLHASQRENDSYSLFARYNADTRIRKNVSLNFSSGLEVGTELTDFDARIESFYTPSKWLTLSAFYAFTTSSGSYAGYVDSSRSGQTTHRVGVGANSRIYQMVINSNLTYYWYENNESLSWNNTVRTILFRRVTALLGANFRWNKYRGLVLTGDERKNLELYSILGFMPWYNASFRLYLSYSREINGADGYSYIINPNLTWRIRRLYLDGEYKFTESKSHDSKRTEHKLFLRMRRSIRL